MNDIIFYKNLKLISKLDPPANWSVGSVQDVFSLGRGRVISQEKISNNSGIYPVYSSQTSNDGEMGRIDTYDFDGELITWTTDGANAGTVFFRNGKFNCTNVCGTLSAKHKIYYQFFAYLLCQFTKGYVSYIGNPKLMNDTMAEIAIAFPPDYETQRKIARILSTIDGQIEKTEAIIAKYQAVKQGMLQDLFTRGIDVRTGQLRPHHEDAPDLYQDSPLGMIPKEWAVSTIGRACLIQNQFRKPISSEIRETMSGKYPYYGPTGIQDYIDEFRVKGRYVLIGEDGDHFLKWSKQEMTLLIEGEFNVNNHAHILEGTETCLTEWVHTFFAHRDITFYLTRQGAGRYKLNKAALKSISFPLPGVTEQRMLVERLSLTNSRIKLDKEALSKLQLLKRGLMQDLLSGKVEVTA